MFMKFSEMFFVNFRILLDLLKVGLFETAAFGLGLIGSVSYFVNRRFPYGT